MMQDLIESRIKKYVLEYENNSDIESSWREPIIAYADSKDKLFYKLKEIITPTHALPTDFLEEAKTVITFFLPFDQSINQSNIKGRLSSKQWAVAYIETNQLIIKLNKEIKQLLEKEGYKSTIIPASHNFDQDKLISDWSHRHVAYIAGLGRFGLNNMLITEKGCAGRVGSIVTDLKIDPTNRYEDELCLYKYDGSCKVCVDRCVINSLKIDNFDRASCYQICLDNDKYYHDLNLAEVCGKCCVDLPCSTEIPKR